jgi:CRISPR-associated protein (Cas_Cas02710)
MLANVGSRDVIFDGKELKPTREEGEKLLGRYDEVAEHVELPILWAGLRHIESLGRRYSEVLDRDVPPVVVLFCTDQQDPAYRANDTAAFAGVISRKLPQLFPDRSENEGLRIRQGKKLLWTFPIRKNPARYDHMYTFFEAFFQTNPFVARPEEWLCFVMASGGTPAMTSMLLLHAIQHFGENCVQVYVTPGQGAATMLAGEHVVRAGAQRRFNEALEVMQFRAAARIVEDVLEGGERATASRYAEHRLAFDFERAVEQCLKTLRQISSGGLRDHLEQQAAVLEQLEMGTSDSARRPILIAELFYNLEVRYACGEFVDVLGRAFRIQEALLTWMVEENTGVRTGRRKTLFSDGGSSLEEEVRSVPGLEAFLINYRTRENAKLELKQEINRTALFAISQHLCNPQAGLPEERCQQASMVVEVAESIERLARLRNETIIAHGFRGVSEGDLIDAYGAESLVEDLRENVGAALGMSLCANPFFELARLLRF